MMKILYFIFLLICLVQFDIASGSDYQSPRVMALGGASHASPMYTDTIYMNPSGLSQMLLPAVSAAGLFYDPNQFNNNNMSSGNNVNISGIYGSHEIPIQIGVGHTNRDDISLIHVALAMALSERLSVGLSGKKYTDRNGSKTSGADGSLSISGIVSDALRVALVIDNLFGNYATDGLSREITIGTKVSFGSLFSLYVDPHWAWIMGEEGSHLGLECGIEIPFMEYWFLRAGEFTQSTIPYESRNGSGFGIGLGLAFPMISIDYAFGRVFAPVLGMTHTLGATFYF